MAVFVADGALRYVELGPGEPRWQLSPSSGQVLDPRFPDRFDFAQDVAFGPAGEIVITRWSGRIHVLGPGDDQRRDLQLPRSDPSGLYYSSGLADDTVCTTYCADVAVVCARLP